MTEQEIQEKLRDIIKEYMPDGTDIKTITQEAHLLNDLHINSANLVDIVIDVEDEFDIEITNEELEKMDTVGDALSIIQTKVS